MKNPPEKPGWFNSKGVAGRAESWGTILHPSLLAALCRTQNRQETQAEEVEEVLTELFKLQNEPYLHHLRKHGLRDSSRTKPVFR